MRNYFKRDINRKLILSVILIISFVFFVNGKRLKKDNGNLLTLDSINFFQNDVYEDTILKTPELIRKYKYPVESHDVVTDDGYILEMHRIPNPGKIPVYLQHGLAGSSGDYVLYGPKAAPAFVLHDAGYDIWLGNHRGNRYSQRHITLKSSSPKFWDFSLAELGKYDVKGSIDYIINVTKFDKIHYVGLSQGSPVVLILCDNKPEYSEKLIGIQGIAPAVYIEHFSSPLLRYLLDLFVKNQSFLKNVATAVLTNMVELGFGPAVYSLCKDGTSTQEICIQILSLSVGTVNMEQTNTTKLPVLFGHYPSGTSFKNLHHMAQLALTGEFKNYDYGRKKNLKVYGQEKPPFFNIKKTKVKYSVYYSSNDALVVNEDVEKLYRELAMPHKKVLCDDYGFNHAEFILCVHCRKFYMERIVSTMKNLENNNL